MKRIVLCFDGTWNAEAEPGNAAGAAKETNVVRFKNSIKPVAADGVVQETIYNAGVGTSELNRLAGGAFGFGLDVHIREGYSELAKIYEDGDEVYIVGFSRGAYTARTLVGMIRNCGLVHQKFADAQTAVAYGIYRTRDDDKDSVVARGFRHFFSRPISIKFLGVWDTVGALGIPAQALARLDEVSGAPRGGAQGVINKLNSKIYEFHDTELSGIVENAYHAVALDEQRGFFEACLWNPKAKLNQTFEQRWFAGAHCNVGGGYVDRKLSDITLAWMQSKALATGIDLTPVQVSPDNVQGALIDSYAEFFNTPTEHLGHLGNILDPITGRVLPPRVVRTVLATRFGNEVLDDSIQARCKALAAYRPQNVGLPAFP